MFLEFFINEYDYKDSFHTPLDVSFQLLSWSR